LPYETFTASRKIPDQLIKKVDRKFVEGNHCIPIEDDGKNIVIITTDPEQTIRVGALRKTFPYSSLFYRVTTKREFRQFVDHFYVGRE
jgi:hypothetical protein